MLSATNVVRSPRTVITYRAFTWCVTSTSRRRDRLRTLLLALCTLARCDRTPSPQQQQIVLPIHNHKFLLEVHICNFYFIFSIWHVRARAICSTGGLLEVQDHKECSGSHVCVTKEVRDGHFVRYVGIAGLHCYVVLLLLFYFFFCWGAQSLLSSLL